MNDKNAKYPGCFYCENAVDHDGDYIGLLHLGFPRCFILIRDYSAQITTNNFEGWLDRVAEINWLDPKDEYTEDEKESVIVMLWNFSVEHESKIAEELDDFDIEY